MNFTWAKFVIVSACFLFLFCGSGCGDSGEDVARQGTDDDDAPPMDDDQAEDDDGDDTDSPPDDGIFVSKDGNDENPGTMISPKKTIQAGIKAAQEQGKSVYVSAGKYVEHFYTKVSLHGGYEPVTWDRDIAKHKTTVGDTNSPAHDWAITLDNSMNDTGHIDIDGFTIVGSGGIHSLQADATIENNTIEVDDEGVYLGDNSVVAILDNVFHGYQGVISASNNTLSITGNNFQVQEACVGTNTDNDIDVSNNTCSGLVGVSLKDDCRATITNNQFVQRNPLGADSVVGIWARSNDMVTAENNSFDIDAMSKFAYGVLITNNGGTEINIIGNEFDLAGMVTEGITLDGLGDPIVATITGNTIDSAGKDYSVGMRFSRADAEVEDNVISAGTSTSSSYGIFVDEFASVIIAGNFITSRTVGQSDIECDGVGTDDFSYSGPIRVSNNHIEVFAEGDSGYGRGLHASDVEDIEIVGNEVIVSRGDSDIFLLGIIIGATEGTAAILNNVVSVTGGDANQVIIGADFLLFGTQRFYFINNSIYVNGNGDTTGVNVGNLSMESTIANNGVLVESGGNAYGFFIDYDSDPVCTLYNNDFWGSALDCLLAGGSPCISDINVVNSCTWGGCKAASGNISDNPEYQNPQACDLHLKQTSPCRNTGIDPTVWYDDEDMYVDFEGDARPYGPGWDIGADEWTP